MKYFKNYRLELLIILIQLIGPISLIGLIIGSVYIFYQISFKRNINLLSVFILFIPSIVLGYNLDSIEYNSSQELANNWIQFKLPVIYTSYVLGPFALSVPFLAALAVPVRLIIYFRNSANKKLIYIWFIVLFISLIGLIWAILNKHESSSGITVGLRIVLTLGAMLFPLSVNKDRLETQLLLIVKISILLFLFGFLNGLWKFVVFAFPGFLIFSDEKKIWKIIAIFSLIIMLSFEFTFTLKLIAIGSFLLQLFYNKKRSSFIFFKNKLFRFFIFTFPIWFVILIIYTNSLTEGFIDNIFGDRFTYKLFEDRVPIWSFTLDLILNSNLFLVQAAREIPVIDYFYNNEEWSFGAHNIYLEMGRQLGVFATLLLSYIMSYIFFKAYKLNKYNVLLIKLILSFFAIYLVWGLTGNALVYNGTGFLVWYIIGQIYQIGLNDLKRR